jgi:hypothetical protein
MTTRVRLVDTGLDPTQNAITRLALHDLWLRSRSFSPEPSRLCLQSMVGSSSEYAHQVMSAVVKLLIDAMHRYHGHRSSETQT